MEAEQTLLPPPLPMPAKSTRRKIVRFGISTKRRKKAQEPTKAGRVLARAKVPPCAGYAWLSA